MFRQSPKGVVVVVAAVAFLLAAADCAAVLYAQTNRAPQSNAEPSFDRVDNRAAARVEEFFELLRTKDVPGAMELLSVKAAPDSSAQRAWAEHLGSIKSVHVVNLSTTASEGRSDTHRTYKVLLDVEMTPSARKAAIPNYGWGENPNVRWITVELERDGAWRIVEIATGP